MKSFLKLCYILFIIILAMPQANTYTKVKWYFDKNWNYMAPYYRTNKDWTKFNNWSTKWNINPFTWEEGKIKVWCKKINYEIKNNLDSLVNSVIFEKQNIISLKENLWVWDIEWHIRNNININKTIDNLWNYCYFEWIANLYYWLWDTSENNLFLKKYEEETNLTTLDIPVISKKWLKIIDKINETIPELVKNSPQLLKNLIPKIEDILDKSNDKDSENYYILNFLKEKIKFELSR